MNTSNVKDGSLRPADVIKNLRKRAALLNHVRKEFDRHGYWEVETPLLSQETCIDQWIEPMEFHAGDKVRYLQTSPEFAMKRLVASGAEAIYQICKAFRGHESGENHNCEFTLLEWYRVGDDYHAQMDFVEHLLRAALDFSIQNAWIPQNALPKKFHRISYESAFVQYANISALTASDDDLIQHAHDLGSTDIRQLRPLRDDVLNFLLATRVEPELEKLGAVFLYDYPANQSALARVRNDEPPVSERFELYVNGIELCNGYQELTDPQELRRRMKQQNALRAARGLREFETETHLISAMESGLPECAGVALGFDRLAMLCLGLKSVREVLSFPFEFA
ncbi:Elongation factor P--(R)-beta-lysine ligase [Thalassoglobus neptunius]|uniref:Elongation factor P--(R)-beta-lysine ligase n=1 Tax=Thalassoglobus neptunius TaxID=1938619 RepID=A0A5C5VQ51_9PLAN|nr:EF-P lysine aminoacylase EpmA [Thalassoglobus neptunius]TWT39921.1 Elongation factor P--(R)-beta-lysine ligase [Thalassoglobus neptunius]